MANDDILKIIEDLKKQLNDLSERYKTLRQEKSGELRSGQNNNTPPASGAATASAEAPAANAGQAAPADRSAQAENASPAATSGSGIPTTLTGSVGRGGDNKEVDVRAVQQRLVRNAIQVDTDGKIGPKTIEAIERFQRARIGVADGRVDPNGNTWKALMGQQVPRQEPPANSGGATNANAGPDNSASSGGGDFSHAGASRVSLSYGARAVKLNQRAENLLKSILASVNIAGAQLTSTLRTYHDQARITMTQTTDANTARWYGQDVLDAKRRFRGNIQAFADWWAARDRSRGRVSSLHLTNHAMDVVPSSNRAAFASKVRQLVGVSGSGVRRIIAKGEMGEPVDHVEFTFKVTNASA